MFAAAHDRPRMSRSTFHLKGLAVHGQFLVYRRHLRGDVRKVTNRRYVLELLIRADARGPRKARLDTNCV
eukprot:s72_g8.t1